MTELRRWLETEEASPEVVELLRNARPARALDAATRDRSRRRIARALAIPAAAGAFFWLQPAALGAALGAAVTGAIVAARMLPAEAPQAGEGTRAPVVESRNEPSPPARLPSRAPRDSEAMPTPPSVERRQAPAQRIENGDTLEREARMLERARALLASNPDAALATLSRHEKEFTHGALGLERELLTVDVLMRLGRKSEAEARGRALRGRAPASLYQARLNELLGEPR